MKANRDLVRRVAGHARLRLTAEQETRFVDELGAILEYVDVLAGLPDAADEASPPQGVLLRVDAVTNDGADPCLDRSAGWTAAGVRVPEVLDT